MNISILKVLKESTLENNVMQAEMIFAPFIIEHNISIASTEHVRLLFCIIIAKGIQFCLKKYCSNKNQWHILQWNNWPS